MNENAIILTRIGLVIGLIASYLTAVGIFGHDRVKKIELLTRSYLFMIANPIDLIKSIFSSKKRHAFPWLIPTIIIFTILGGGLIMYSIDRYFPDFVNNKFYYFEVYYFPITLFSSILSLVGLFLLTNYLQSKEKLRKKRIVQIMVVLSGILFFLAFLLFLLPCAILWFLLLLILSIITSILTTPLAIGCYLEKKFDLTSALESTGMVLLALSFLIQFIATLI